MYALFLPKCAQGICTAEVKGAGLGKLIPQLFKPNSGIVPFLRPQHRNHFTEQNDSLVFCNCSVL
jgi:hypothetical protein